MIRHFVLMRFQDDYMTEHLFQEFSERFRSLQTVLPDHVKNVGVYLNCVERDSNMDFMVEMTLDSEASLSIYLTHPVHMALVDELSPHIISRCSFDYMLYK